jgi:hypothetical protein
MTSPLGRGWTGAFGDEDIEEKPDGGAAPAGADAPIATVEPDYSFEGYSVEFIDKVALMPVTQAPTSKAQWRRTG